MLLSPPLIPLPPSGTAAGRRSHSKLTLSLHQVPKASQWPVLPATLSQPQSHRGMKALSIFQTYPCW